MTSIRLAAFFLAIVAGTLAGEGGFVGLLAVVLGELSVILIFINHDIKNIYRGKGYY